MARNYYVILGVEPDATQEQIKSAYRQRVKKLHPDYYSQGSEPFLALQEAYEVLNDPERRRAYDAALARQRRPRREPRPPRRCPVEPLVPSEPVLRSRGAFSEWPFDSLFQELLAPLWFERPSPARPAPGGGAQEIHLEVSLTAEQARRGGRFRLRLPLQVACPACGGQGSRWFFPCPHCSGRGTAVVEYPVRIAFEPGIAAGTTASLSLDRPGARPVRLILHFEIADR